MYLLWYTREWSPFPSPCREIWWKYSLLKDNIGHLSVDGITGTPLAKQGFQSRYPVKDVQGRGVRRVHESLLRGGRLPLRRDLGGTGTRSTWTRSSRRRTRFKERIAHGLLTAGTISAAIGMKLPGPGCVYLSQTLEFKAPVFPGDEITARVEIVEVISGKRLRMRPDASTRTRCW